MRLTSCSEGHSCMCGHRQHTSAGKPHTQGANRSIPLKHGRSGVSSYKHARDTNDLPYLFKQRLFDLFLYNYRKLPSGSFLPRLPA